MSKIDWSGAPEGSTGAMVANFTGGTVVPGDIEFLGHPNALDRECYQEGPDSWVYHRHPADGECTSWSGEGLPPVGMTCERRFPDLAGSSWNGCIILAHGAKKIFIRDNCGDEWAHSIDEVEFRPYRTPEQIAAEEREKVISEAMKVMAAAGVHPSAETCRKIATDYIDAGYRKQQPKPE